MPSWRSPPAPRRPPDVHMTQLRFALLLAFAVLAAPLPALIGAQIWELQFFHDVDEAVFAINDLAFPSPTRGVAAGYLVENGKVRPRALVTSDGGKSWSFVPTKAVGIALFFLNDTVGWMVTNKGGIWRTGESGRSWRKMAKLSGVLRVYFLDEQRGWAVGTRKAIYETIDGGKNWTPLPAAAAPKSTKAYTTYGWIEFANPKFGSIVGWSDTPRLGRSRLPDWMDPERAERRRQWPSLSIDIQTNDGGRTWKHSTTSMFGQITRLRILENGKGLALVEFRDAFKWPSEVYRFDSLSGTPERAFREENRAVTDVALVGGGIGYLAAVEPVGTLQTSPIPGRLVMLRSDDLLNWVEMEVDYRAVARRAVLAAADAGHIWVATDTGMILKLVEE